MTLSRAIILDGIAVAQTLRSEILAARQRTGVTPGLATILVGDHSASMQFVRNKNLAAVDLGFNFFLRMLPSNVSEERLLETVDELNDDVRTHGIVVQLPLPKHIRASRILQAIMLHKDVDGFHASNIGSLALGNYKNTAYSSTMPCAAKACDTFLDHYGVDTAGKTALVIGRSRIAGMPTTLFLMHRGATVINVGKRTPIETIKQMCQMADIVVAAAGVPNMVRGDWIKPGATVIDIGISYVLKDGISQCVGDVNFDEVQQVARHITPVPGGIGPVCVMELLRNTLNNAIEANRAVQDNKWVQERQNMIIAPSSVIIIVSMLNYSAQLILNYIAY